MPMSAEVERRLGFLQGVVAVIAAGVVLGSIAVVAILVWHASTLGSNSERIKTLSEQSAAALCAFKTDLERRIEATEDYLAKHPEAEPVPGITRATLKQSLENVKSTYRAFSSVTCPTGTDQK